MQIDIKASNHVALFGRTGSGKSTLAKALLLRFRRFAVLDAKHTFTVPGNGVITLPAYDKNVDRQIIRVPFDNEYERWADSIERIWRDGNRILYIDEATLITKTRTILPEYGKAIRTGRERGIGVWSGTQRPKEIPSVIFTEAEHFFVFQLTYKPDRDKVVSFTGDGMEPFYAMAKDHNFVYYNVSSNEYTLTRLDMNKESL